MKKYSLATCLLLVFCGCTRFQPTIIKSKKQSQTIGTTSTPTIHITAHTICHDTPSPGANNIIEQVNLLSLQITNKTNTPIFIDPIQTTPHIMQSKEFAQMVPKSYGCYFIPAAAVSCTGLLFLWQVGLPLAGLLTLFGINQSRKAATRTIDSFTQHALEDGIKTIPAFSSKTFLVAIHYNEYCPEITLSVNIKGKDEHCTVHLKKSIQTSYNLF